MNTLFHKFQSRQFQFSLELMSRLSAQKEVSNKALYEMATEYGMEHADKCILPLVEYGLLKKTDTGVQMVEDIAPAQVSLSNIEEEYLQYILRLPEADLFLNGSLQEKLCDSGVHLKMSQFQYYQVQEKAPAPTMAPEQFQTLIRAIRERRWIHYAFRSRDNKEPTQATAVPWKLEYSAYDSRWWVILYTPEQQRTIKAWLPNLQDIKLGSYADVTDENIEEAMQKLLVDETVVLRITKDRNALDRCARVFERQMLQQILREPDGSYKLSFRYYKFDRNEILRKLLYLGPAVQLLEPPSLCKDLLEMINRALEIDSYQF